MVRMCFCEPSAQWMAAFAASTPPPFLSFSAVAAGMYLCRSESPAAKSRRGFQTHAIICVSASAKRRVSWSVKASDKGQNLDSLRLWKV